MPRIRRLGPKVALEKPEAVCWRHEEHFRLVAPKFVTTAFALDRLLTDVGEPSVSSRRLRHDALDGLVRGVRMEE